VYVHQSHSNSGSCWLCYSLQICSSIA
jgi:hypothetical protein